MLTDYRLFKNTLCIAASALVLAGCASSSLEPQNDGLYGQQIEDPFEEYNRSIFAFNSAFDDVVIHPVIKSYRAVVPEPARKGVSNFLSNLKAPVRLANQILQGDTQGAGDEAVRTVVNTLIGIGGLIDVAGHEGLKQEQEDFGQTLGVWGVGHGPYLVVPIIGPSSLRDYAGYAVDSFADPLRWYLFNTDQEGLFYAKAGADYLDLRNSLMDVLQELEASSIDYYAAVRSTYVQRRAALVRDEAAADYSMDYDIPEYD